MSSLEFLFWDIDDFCVSFEAQWEKKLLSCGAIKRKRQKSLCLSEVMTILIAFHHRRAGSLLKIIIETSSTSI